MKLAVALALLSAAHGLRRARPLTQRLRVRATPRMGSDDGLSTWGPDWDLDDETIALHGGWAPDPATTARAVPVYRTAPYQFRSTTEAAELFGLAKLGNIYTRLMNPTTDVLEKRFSLLEGGPELGGLAVASGTNAAFYAIINVAKEGDNVIASRQLYGGTFTQFNDILPQFGITIRFVDVNDPKAFTAAADDKTRAFFCETCSNPALDVADLEAISAEAHSIGVPLIVDDTFTTPALCKPFEHGADIIVSSLTKWSGGHGNGVGGIVVDSGKFNWGAGKHPLYTEPDTSYGGLRWGLDLPEPLLPLAFILRMRTVPLRNLGGCISPDNSWMFLTGIETLHGRMERHCDNAMGVATYLKAHPKVDWVRFPGLHGDPMYDLQKKYLKGKGGPLVVFGIKGGKEAGQAFINNLKLFSHVANVGDAKSLAIHPASTTHSQMNAEEQAAAGVPPELIRLSVGIEAQVDIIQDLKQALAATEV